MQPDPPSPVDPDVTAIHASAPPVDGDDEGLLASRVASGDRSAGEELVRRHQAAVRGFLRAVCYDRSAVEDLAQETFLRALRHADRFDPKYPMRGWLLTIARRLSINHAEKARRRRPEPGVELTKLPDVAIERPGHAGEQEEQKALTRNMIQQAMNKLTEPQRTAIAMHYQQGLPLDQIAVLMQMPVGTIKSHLHRGRQRMRELLEPQVEKVWP